MTTPSDNTYQAGSVGETTSLNSNFMQQLIAGIQGLNQYESANPTQSGMATLSGAASFLENMIDGAPLPQVEVGVNGQNNTVESNALPGSIAEAGINVSGNGNAAITNLDPGSSGVADVNIANGTGDSALTTLGTGSNGLAEVNLLGGTADTVLSALGPNTSGQLEATVGGTANEVGTAIGSGSGSADVTVGGVNNDVNTGVVGAGSADVGVSGTGNNVSTLDGAGDFTFVDVNGTGNEVTTNSGVQPTEVCPPSPPAPPTPSPVCSSLTASQQLEEATVVQKLNSGDLLGTQSALKTLVGYSAPDQSAITNDLKTNSPNDYNLLSQEMAAQYFQGLSYNGWSGDENRASIQEAMARPTYNNNPALQSLGQNLVGNFTALEGSGPVSADAAHNQVISMGKIQANAVNNPSSPGYDSTTYVAASPAEIAAGIGE